METLDGSISAEARKSDLIGQWVSFTPSVNNRSDLTLLKIKTEKTPASQTSEGSETFEYVELIRRPTSNSILDVVAESVRSPPNLEQQTEAEPFLERV